MRWIEQEGLSEIEAIVVKEELVRIEGLPFMQRIPGLPELDRGQKIRLAVLGCDYIELILETKLLEVLEESEEVLDEELPDTQEQEPEQSERPEGSESSSSPA